MESLRFAFCFFPRGAARAVFTVSAAAFAGLFALHEDEYREAYAEIKEKIEKALAEITPGKV
jgi:hypothetical protein